MVMGLELIVGGLSWTAKNNNKVFENACLGESPETLLLGEFVRVHVLSCCFASCHEENMIAHQSSRIKKGNKSKENQGKWNSEMVDGLSERNTLAVFVKKNLCKRCSY